MAVGILQPVSTRSGNISVNTDDGNSAGSGALVSGSLAACLVASVFLRRVGGARWLDGIGRRTGFTPALWSSARRFAAARPPRLSAAAKAAPKRARGGTGKLRTEKEYHRIFAALPPAEFLTRCEGRIDGLKAHLKDVAAQVGRFDQKNNGTASRNLEEAFSGQLDDADGLVAVDPLAVLGDLPQILGRIEGGSFRAARLLRSGSGDSQAFNFSRDLADCLKGAVSSYHNFSPGDGRALRVYLKAEPRAVIRLLRERGRPNDAKMMEELQYQYEAARIWAHYWSGRLGGELPFSA